MSVLLLSALMLGNTVFAYVPSQPHTISFTRYANYVWVPTSVNGSEPLLFVLDSGASTCLINERAASALKLSVRNEHRETKLGTGEGSSTVGSARNATLSFAGINIRKNEIAVTSFDNLEAAVGHRIDGILGNEIFEQYVVEIDYAKGELVLHDPRTFSYSGHGQTLQLELKDGRSFVRGTLEFSGSAALDALFVIDTGANGSVGLHSPFVQRHRLLAPPRKSIQHFVHGAAGTALERIARADNLRLGPVLVHSVDVGLSSASKGSTADPSYDGVIGGEVLRRFKIIFNYPRKQIILEPSSALNDPFDVDTSGISLVATGENLQTIVVEHVLEDSPASSAGLKEGDAIISVDGTGTSGYTLDQLRQIFKRDNSEHQLDIRRGDKPLQVRMNSRKLS